MRRTRSAGSRTRRSARPPQALEADVANRRGAGRRGGLDHDRIPCADLPFLDDAEVRPEARGALELLHEARVAHADAELEAREARLADLQERGPDAPAAADHGGRHVDTAHGQV